MSLRRCLVAPAVLFAFAALTGCGGNGSGITNPVAPPSGSFGLSNLNGTYVFSVSGTDSSSTPSPYALVGTFTANGSGGISGGTYDMNDAQFPAANVAAVANAPISGGSYILGVDGRGKVTLNASTPFGNSGSSGGNIVLDFVLQDSSHGLIIQFDNNASGSGTLDLQTSGVSPAGSYAFSLAGGTVSSSSPIATVGNFAVGSGGTITGLEDFNDDGVAAPNETLSGSLAIGPSSTPATTLITGTFGTLTFDVYPIDATHLKMIELDQVATLSGDAFSQTSPGIPAQTMAFTLGGGLTTPVAIGGFMVSDGNGNITSASSEDVNNGGNVAPTVGFSAQYAQSGTGRFLLNNFSNFFGGTAYAAYPSSGGLLLLEIDTSGLMFGAAYTQTAPSTFSTSSGYGFNLSGMNQSAGAEVDDIAEFATSTTGTTATGVIDENSPATGPVYGLALSGTYTLPSGGRGAISAAAGNNNVSTINGGVGLTFYTVDGTTFPFIQTDNTTGQVATGVMVAQNPSASSASAALRSHMFVAAPLFRSHAMLKKKQK